MAKNSKWYRLDTSAKIYPALESSRNPALFRLTVTLHDKVNKFTLLSALKDIKHRFPYFNVHLRKGLFWNYFEENEGRLIVWRDTPSPCQRIYPAFNNGYLYKIRYYNNTIALEIFHALTDGYGAMEFLKCLVARYLFLKGKIDEKQPGILQLNEEPADSEYEDAFLRVLEEEKEKPIEAKRSLFGKVENFQIQDKHLALGQYKVITSIIEVADIKKVSKSYNTTITNLLASLYLEALIHVQASQVKDVRKHKTVAVQIPVNMRKYYPSTCMRNFSLFVIPTLDPREVHCFEDIVTIVKQFMAEHLTHDHLLTMIRDNCSIATHQVIKHVPNFIKKHVIRYITNTKGATQFSGTISNLGIVQFPDQMQPHIESITFLTGPSPHNKYSSGVVSFNNQLYFSFGRSIKDAYIEKHVLRRLVQMGVRIKVKSN